jgi:hypothetical protein
MKKSHGPDFLKHHRRVINCADCRGRGVVKGLFYELDCVCCTGFGWVYADDGRSVEPTEMPALIRFLTERILLLERDMSRVVRGSGVQQQYEQNNRLGPGGTHYTGD